MLNVVYGEKQHYCDGLSRRQALRLGATGLFGGLGLPSLMQMQAVAASGRAARAKACIFIMLEGGPGKTSCSGGPRC